MCVLACVCYVCFGYCSASASTVAVCVDEGLGKLTESTGTQCKPLYFFFNVSRMLVNLTLLKPAVKCNAKHDISPAHRFFFNFIYKEHAGLGSGQAAAPPLEPGHHIERVGHGLDCPVRLSHSFLDRSIANF